MSKIYLVKIRRLTIVMFIGVHEHERRSRQRVAIDVELEMEYPADGFSKGIYKNVGCYETLVGKIKNEKEREVIRYPLPRNRGSRRRHPA